MGLFIAYHQNNEQQNRINGPKDDIALTSKTMIRVLLLASLVACGLGELHMLSYKQK